MKNIIIIAGPTASGKTATSIELAKRLDGEIVSADSMQIYKFMDIGTAKITKDEMQGIPHYMIDIVYPFQEFSVAMYKDMASTIIDDIISRGKVPIIAGGTGLYINSLIRPMDFAGIAEDKAYRDELYNLCLEKGNEYVHNMLKDIDPTSYEKLYPNDTKRVIRALEVYKNTGKPISEYQRDSVKIPSEYNAVFFALNMERSILYSRINDRVDYMFEKGLIDEVKGLYNMGYTSEMTSMKAIGYKEVFDYLNETLTLQETLDIIKQSSRRYAKRQLTWFRKNDDVNWINVDEFNSPSEIAIYMENIIKTNSKFDKEIQSC